MKNYDVCAFYSVTHSKYCITVLYCILGLIYVIDFLIFDYQKSFAVTVV
jgi:hypothetical protein